MTEINARTVMFNLGPEDAIDSTISAKIACYTKRKQLAYKLTDEGVLFLDGRGKKIHLKEEPKWNFVRLCMCYYYISLHNNREIYVQNASTS